MVGCYLKPGDEDKGSSIAKQISSSAALAMTICSPSFTIGWTGKNIAKGTMDPGADCFNQSAYSACLHIFQIKHILHLLHNLHILHNLLFLKIVHILQYFHTFNMFCIFRIFCIFCIFYKLGIFCIFCTFCHKLSTALTAVTSSR